MTFFTVAKPSKAFCCPSIVLLSCPSIVLNPAFHQKVFAQASQLRTTSPSPLPTINEKTIIPKPTVTMGEQVLSKKPSPAVVASVSELIGNTPLVKLNRIPQSLGIEADIYAKVELFNAGGSVKDRIALRMVEEAEKSGRIKPGDTLIEPTSGNT